MTEETLQSEGAPATIEQETQANPIQESELATGAETTAGESEQSSTVNQENINKVINKKHFEKMEAERRAIAAEAQVRDFQEKARLVEQQQIDNLPAMPDSFDDDYDQKIVDWQEAMQRKADFDANNRLVAASQRAQQQQAQMQQQQQINDRNTKFLDNAKASNISNNEMQGLFQTISDYGGVGNDNAAFIMDVPDAALIVKHLAANPQEITVMQQMNGYTLANHINVNVRAKAKALKPKQSSAPQPATNIQGGGADQSQGKHALIKGFSIE